MEGKGGQNLSSGKGKATSHKVTGGSWAQQEVWVLLKVWSKMTKGFNQYSAGVHSHLYRVTLLFGIDQRASVEAGNH